MDFLSDVGIGALIGLGLFVLLAIVYYILPDHLKNWSSETFTEFASSIGCSVMLILASLAPLFLFSGGFVVDTISQTFQYSIPSLVGFASVLVAWTLGSPWFAKGASWIMGFLPSIKTAEGGLNWLGVVVQSFIVLILAIVPMILRGTNQPDGATFGTGIVALLVGSLVLAGNGLFAKPQAMTGGSAFMMTPYPTGYCELPGFSWASTSAFPVSTVLTQSILWYYMAKDLQLGITPTGPAVVSSLLGVLQWAALYWKGECLQQYGSGSAAPLIGYVMGAALGSLGYVAAKMATPRADIPTVYEFNIPAFSKKTTSDIPIKVGTPQDTSAPVDEDQDAFVCEAYKDGELITSTIVD